jgi:hypothetical protein
MKGQKMNYSIRQMTRYLMLAITSVVAFHAMPLEARAQPEPENSSLRLYDNFSAPNIDPSRWYTVYSCDAKTTLECVRQVQNGSLRLRARAYGAEPAMRAQNMVPLNSPWWIQLPPTLRWS